MYKIDMNYDEALEYLLKIPMFQNVGGAAYKPGLGKVEAFCRYLESPQKKFSAIHVAGTNGKGSVSHMIASVLQSCGFKIGLYTSPHINKINERVRINGVAVCDDVITKFVSGNIDYMDAFEPSFFEVTTALAFDTFAKEKVDIAVIETGLGGRLDATNIINPIISVITNISLDHTAILGKTLPEIAAEKAGIIKEGCPVVIGEAEYTTAAVFIERATKMNSKIFFADMYYGCDSSEPDIFGRAYSLTMLRTGYKFKLKSDLCGYYQKKNIVTVLGVFEALNQLKNVKVERKFIERGIENCVALTGLKGRWQTLLDHPLVICDIAHNEAGIRVVSEQICAQNFDNLYIVLGVLKDKEIDQILSLLPDYAQFIFTSPPVERAMSSEELLQHGQKLGLNAMAIENVNDAVDYALELATVDDMIYIGGSTFTVAEVLKRL